MRYLLLFAAVLLPESLAFPLQLRPALALKDIEEYLDKFFPVLTSTQTPSLEERIKALQKFFHLTVTGKLDTETEKVLKRPRCGMPDVTDYRALPRRPRWTQKHLTYKIASYTPDLPRHKVDDAIRRALKVWADVTPLTFQRVYHNYADIRISFARREHGDGSPFDGRGGILAHAFMPGPGLGGDAHFDDDERWSETNQEVNLFLVAAHEFGHSLGLDHSSVYGALMHPVYSFKNPATFRLAEDDKRRIQRLYGKS
ncbi:MMP18 protein, partial [Upupa epops]|nr:MMP18 protein [Upupa epops]